MNETEVEIQWKKYVWKLYKSYIKEKHIMEASWCWGESSEATNEEWEAKLQRKKHWRHENTIKKKLGGKSYNGREREKSETTQWKEMEENGE